MSRIEMAPRAEMTEIDKLKATHRELMERLDSDASILVEGSPARETWLRAMEKFFERVNACIKGVPVENEARELDWLARAASEWQLTMSRRLKLPRDVRKELGIQPETKAKATPKTTWTRVFLERGLQRESFFIGANRKILNALRRYRQLEQMQAHRVHAEIPSDPHEQWQDWYDACRFLTLDVILGKVDFARLVDPSGYEFLDAVWLDDVKQLHAYLMWEKSNSDGGFQRETDFYYPACNEIEARLFRYKSDVAFESVAQWWKERYQTSISPALSRSDAICEVIHRKADRIRERTGRADDAANLAAAKQYVDAFYFQLIPAVQGQNEEAIECIYRALRNTIHGCELVTGLEAAIASAFIDFSSVWQRCGPRR